MTAIDAAGTGRDGATAGQIRAVYTVMRILAEDDRERGLTKRRIVCDACRRHRDAAGSVDYAGTRLCNGCATDYELLHLGGQARDVATYLAKLPPTVAPVPGRDTTPHQRRSSLR